MFWIPFAPFFAIPYGAYVATVAVKETMNVTAGAAQPPPRSSPSGLCSDRLP